MSTRRPAVAGSFYPADPRQLRESVEHCLAAAVSPPAALAGKVAKALIAPHAGYVYSGPIAGSAYALLKPRRDEIRRVVLMGPAHRVPLRGLAASSASAFATPIGEMTVDQEGVETALGLPQVCIADAAHEAEHSLEVQLPFLQVVLAQVSLIPFAVGDASADDVADVLELLWGGPETLIVISSDLSHYYDYATARRLDRETSNAIEGLQPEALSYESACGRVPVRGLLKAAATHRLKATTIDLRNSGDTAGSRDEVVGYGAYAFA